MSEETKTGFIALSENEAMSENQPKEVDALVNKFLQAKRDKQGADVANATKIRKINDDKYEIIFVAKGLKPLAPSEVSRALLEQMIIDLTV